jgi:hypothetical protein
MDRQQTQTCQRLCAAAKHQSKMTLVPDRSCPAGQRRPRVSAMAMKSHPRRGHQFVRHVGRQSRARLPLRSDAGLRSPSEWMSHVDRRATRHTIEPLRDYSGTRTKLRPLTYRSRECAVRDVDANLTVLVEQRSIRKACQATLRL